MAHPPTTRCQFTNSDYNTPIGAKINTALEFLRIHVDMAHPNREWPQGKTTTAKPPPIVRATTTVKEDPEPPLQAPAGEVPGGECSTPLPVQDHLEESHLEGHPEENHLGHLKEGHPEENHPEKGHLVELEPTTHQVKTEPAVPSSGQPQHQQEVPQDDLKEEKEEQDSAKPTNEAEGPDAATTTAADATSAVIRAATAPTRGATG